MLKRHLGFVVSVPLSIVLCVLPFEPGILPLETLFDRFGMIPAHVYMASLWFFYLLGIPAAMAGVLNQLSATRGVCLTYFIAFGGIAVLYSSPDGPDWYFRVLVCVSAPLVLCGAYLVGYAVRRYFRGLHARRSNAA